MILPGSRSDGARFLTGTIFCLLAVAELGSAVGRGVETGLSEAVRWKWRVAPSATDRRFIPEPAPRPTATPVPQAVIYEVQRGDALAIIARKYGLTAEHLKVFNGLTSNLIQIGQLIRIPSLPEAQAIAPLPKPRSSGKKFLAGTVRPVTEDEIRNAAVQVFLDRENFSSGPIDGQRNPTFEKVLYFYRLAHPEISAPGALPKKVEAEIGDGFTKYVLRDEDFRFIQPPKAARPGASAYEELAEATHLDYRTPWEFVAERFHCSEVFLKKLNTNVPGVPDVGTELVVPKVKPFEIERLGLNAIQPSLDPNLPVRAAIVDLSLLQIFQNETLVAVLPLTMARPGLRGRGSWAILNAILLPRLGTIQEERERSTKPKPPYGQPEPEGTPAPPTTLSQEQFLGSGPNSPIGIIWINLAKADSTEPLIYGLHGTSAPDADPRPYSLGGLQLTNWDILRAMQRLPAGTALEWVEGGLAPAAVAPAAQP